MTGPPVTPVDQDQRDAAVRERERNVVMEAGAGTGKTSTLVRRLVELVAPADDGPPLSMRRIAAITFTRRAAGELALRIRGELLSALADPAASEERRRRVRQALGEVDTAYVGTIHSFADRLLRMKPAESRLSPSYEIVEDEEELVDEAYQLLLRGCESGTLADLLAGSGTDDMADEASRTVTDVLTAGIRAQTQETGFAPRPGLDALVAGFIRNRDVPPDRPPPGEPDLPAVRRSMQEFMDLVAPISGDSDFGAWAKWMARRIAALMGQTDPLVLFAEMATRIQDRLSNPPKKGADCGGDNATWRIWRALTEGGKHRDAEEAPPLADDLTGPLRSWLGRRLVRLSPVVLALYERVKARRGVVDQIDLLLKLRNLLRDHLEARRYYQGLFDHVLVDEFQDTDPLQAEIVQFLCEREPVATRADDVQLAAGRLTVVGDPKQSIYRFRRADVETYDRVATKLAATALRVELTANFRSVPSLTGWFNDRFPALLGEDPGGRTFDPENGQVFHRHLGLGRPDDRWPAVHVLPFERQAGAGHADEYRALEAEALAHYLRWLVEHSGETTVHRGTGQPRPLQYEDICVLAIATTNLRLLFEQLDRLDVPYAATGGRLFLSDPLQRQFLLALRAIADPDDGVAQAALLRPPFFAVDLRDLFESKAPAPQGPGPEQVQAAGELIADLRERRHAQPAGSTARELLERTGLGRSVALGPNGGQRLQRLGEICHLLEMTAAEDGLDYDGATAQLRQWVTDPPQLDAPRPVAESAVQVMTVHQAKGLEFPVVVLWDGQALLSGRNTSVAWKVAPDGRSWSLALDGLKASHPMEVDLSGREKRYLDQERRRLVYVAATRARDLLVLPQAGQVNPKFVSGLLLSGTDTAAVHRLDTYEEGKGADWSAVVQERAGMPPTSAAALNSQLDARWLAGAKQAGKIRFHPVGVARAAYKAWDEEQEDTESQWKDREGRYGRTFGTVVHRAMQRCVRDRGLTAAEAVHQAAEQAGLREHHEDAVRDVERAVAALEAEGLLRDVGATLRLEYPISGPHGEERVLLGCVDLVRIDGDGLTVIDYKTDPPPDGAVEQAMPVYAEQVRTYAKLLVQAGVGEGSVRCGLLFTRDGCIRWVA